MTSFDGVQNFAIGQVRIAPAPPNSGTTITLEAGQGADMPTPPFNATVWPPNVAPTVQNAEIVRCTSLATDTLTLTRGQENTPTPIAILVGYQVAATLTAGGLMALETAINAETARAEAVEATKLGESGALTSGNLLKSVGGVAEDAGIPASSVVTATALPPASSGYHLAPTSTSSNEGEWVEDTSSGGNYQTVEIDGTAETQRGKLNLIPGTNVTLSAADNPGADSTDVTINATPSGSNGSLAVMGTTPILGAANLWIAGLTYGPFQTVTHSGNTYLCTTTHTAGTFATDLASGYWILISGSAVAPGPIYNASSATLPNLTAAVARGTGLIVCLGDSTTSGHGSVTFGQNYPSVLVAFLNALGLSVAQTWTHPNAQGSQGIADPGMSVGSSWTNTAFASTPGSAWAGTGTGTLAYSPCTAGRSGPAAVNAFDIYYEQGPTNYGTANVNVDGGSTLATISSQNATEGIEKLTVSGLTLGTHTLNIVQTGSHGGSGLLILGIRGYNASAPGIELMNMGAPSSTTANWTASGTGFYGYNWAPIYQPTLTIIDLGINDASGTVALATYQSNMQALITRGLQSGAGDVVLKSFVPSIPGTLTDTWTLREKEYIPGLLALASANNVPLIDVYNRWGGIIGGTLLQAAYGYYEDVNASLHPNPNGYTDVASVVANALAVAI